MLDRMSLSMKNGWLDRVYIHYTIENIMEDLDCTQATAVKIMEELDSRKRIGLIEKKRQGLGKPDIIYVKNFAMVERRDVVNDDTGDCVKSEVQNLNFKRYKSKNSGGIKGETTVVQELNGNYNNKSYAEKNHINLSLGVDSKLDLQAHIGNIDDEMDYVTVVKENIEYDCFMQNTTSKIGNIKGYMLTTLYNAPNSMMHYYQQAVLSEMYN